MPNIPVVVLNGTLTNIANAIRGKNGSSDTYKPSEMPAAITAIPTGGVGIPREVSQSGVFQMPTTAFSYSLPSTARDLGTDVLYAAFENDTAVTAIDFSGLTAITGQDAMHNMCFGCTNLITVDLGGVTNIATNGVYQAFRGCTNLTSVDLGALETIGTQGLYGAFYGCTNLSSIDLSNVRVVGGNGLQSAFYQCSTLASMSFDSLEEIGMAGLQTAFQSCTNLTTLSFPSLTSASFGNSTNQFNGMIQFCAGVTIHFPAAAQAKIETLTGYPSFGGTNTTVLFDL